MQLPNLSRLRMNLINRKTFLAIIMAIGMSGLLNACFKSGNSVTQGTEVENEIVGEIFALNGQPVAGAKVRLFPVSYSPQKGAPKQGQASAAFISTTTDSKGRYSIDSLPHGEYNILAEKDGLLAYQDSIGIASTGVELPPDTLKVPGSIHGIVAVQPNHDPSTAIVEVLGTNVFVNVDRNGKFALPALGEGRYSVKVTTTLPEYTPLFTGFNVMAGQADSLPDTLRIHFTGIPVVTGLRFIHYDTLARVVTFAWSTPDFPNLLGYGIFRDSAKAVSLSQSTINTYRVEDTIYSDTLPFDLDWYSGTKSLEYRVRIQDRESNYGPAYYFLRVNAPPPSTASTVIGLEALGPHGDSTSIGDTLRVAATFWNPGRRNVRLTWALLGEGKTPRYIRISGEVETDTLALVFHEPGNHNLELKVEDDAGSAWTQSIQLAVLLDRPQAFAGNDTTVFLGDSLWVTGIASDGFGSIRKWEWDLEGKGNFVTYPNGGPVKVPLPNTNIDDFPITLRVTDDDGLIQTHTRHIEVSRSRSLPSLPIAMFRPQVVVLSGIFYAFDTNTKRAFSYNSSRNDWTELAPRIASRLGFAAVVLEGKIYLVGGYSPSISDYYWNSGQADNAVEAYDPKTNKWEQKANMNFRRYSNQIVSSDGHIFAISPGYNDYSQYNIDVYDPLMDAWTLIPRPSGSDYAYLFWDKDHFNDIGYNMGSFYTAKYSDSFERIAPSVKLLLGCDGVMPNLFAQGDGVIYGTGPDLCRSTDPQSNLWAIDPNTGTFKALPPLKNGGSAGRAIAYLGNHLFLFGGEGYLLNRNVEEYILP